MSFIDKYLEHSKDYESPGSFWIWSAYAAIAAVLRDNVYAPYGDKKLYPNIYILFLAVSGARKDPPIQLCHDVVKIVNNTKVIAGRASIQAILDELARTETNAKTGKLTPSGSAILIAPELTSGLVSDEAAVNILTDIYDTKADFKHMLRHSPSFKVDRIVFSALMGSNEAMIKTLYDTRAAQGGLLARTMLIVPNEHRPPYSLWTTPEEEEKRKKSVQDLGEELRQIAQLKGSVTFTPTAQTEFDKWYHPFRISCQNKNDKSGILGRIHTSIKKISMTLAANDITLEVSKAHMEKAIDISLALLPHYENFVMGSGKSNVGQAGAAILLDLMKEKGHSLSRRDIINRHWQDIGNAEEIDKILITLEHAGNVELCDIIGGGIGYRLTKRIIERLKGGK